MLNLASTRAQFGRCVCVCVKPKPLFLFPLDGECKNNTERPQVYNVSGTDSVMDDFLYVFLHFGVVDNESFFMKCEPSQIIIYIPYTRLLLQEQYSSTFY
jgi:hypothetical protein